MPEQSTHRTIPFEDSEEIGAAIKNLESFEMGGCEGRMGEAVELAERAISSAGMTSRVYTKGRSAALLAGLANPGLGLALAASMAAHNLATLYPDYEIVKRPIDRVLRLSFVGDDPTLAEHASRTFSSAKSILSNAAEAFEDTWEKHVPSADELLKVFARIFPSSSKAGESDETSEGVETRAYEAARVMELEKKLVIAGERYAEQNRANEFSISIFAIGTAIAACDGKCDAREENALKEFVLGASATHLPSKIKEALDTLIQQPPTFDQAMEYVARLDRDAWSLVDDLLFVVSKLDGEATREELAFIEKWEGFKAQSRDGRAA